MRIDPALVALRSNDAPQRQAQQAVWQADAAWRADGDWAQVLAQLELYGGGVPLAQCDVLAQAVSDHGIASALAATLSGAYCDVLWQEPLAHIPLRHFHDGHLSSLMLGRSGAALLTLVAIEPGERASDTVIFANGERHDIVLSGHADARLIDCVPAGDGTSRLEETRLDLHGGRAFSLDLGQQAVLLERVDQRMVTLRLRRAAPHPAVSREFDLRSHAQLHQASGSIAESRQEMMLALLGRMGRSDAAPIMAQMTREGSDHLRWQAVRECLALDTGAGFHALCAIARDPDDSLADAAGALRAQLLEAHPVLASLEETLCPA